MALLNNKKIVITRAQSQTSKLRNLLEEKGASVIGIPTIEVVPFAEKQATIEVFAEIATYDWIIFTSANGVKYFFETFFKAFKDIRSLGIMRIAAIGESTAAELEKLHLQVDVIPKQSDSVALADELIKEHTLEHLNMLVITGNLNQVTMADKLEKEGMAIVDSLQVYETKHLDISKNANLAEFKKNGADAIIFTSSSTANSYFSQTDKIRLSKGATTPAYCSIGPITSKTIADKKASVAVEAKEATIECIVKDLEAYFKKA